ncbi:T9SS type A sorting domain-containing protein [Kordia sp. YSTF-M3]|uniref:T9SS type A sorting domain-containing protein n=1 Tax=Kordia aestuariivivens TaxID=2759037 RepID=A0ABR7QFE1_9FLAO|nr:T9SS type A sorting domain-containing protein [Kordia aestuariivivens]MBC8757290.1 T9SS type A sorting domain-containing protein [Kordia aestuariivivens]
MKKLLLLFCTFLFCSLTFSQELPIDFSDPLHQFINDPIASPAQFNLITDPNDSNNDVAEIINNGGNFSKYELRLTTLIDVSDPNNNTITLDYYNITNESVQVFFVLDSEQFGGYPIGIVANTTGVIGWETLSFDFDNALNLSPHDAEPVVLSKYGKISLYIYNNFPLITSCYIDNIQGAQSGGAYREFDGDALLTSQQEINDFGAMGYSKVNGSLRIVPQVAGTSTDINDLSPLSSLHTIGIESENDLFEITDNDNLTSLQGLQNVKSLFASTRIKDNASLQSLSALGNMEVFFATPNLVGDLTIDNNDMLSNLDGFHNILITCDVNILNNDSLLTIANLSLDGSEVLIENNSSLVSLENLDSDDDIFKLTIRNNDNLTTFTNITIPQIKRVLTIDDNDALTNLLGLENISIGVFLPTGEINIMNNDNLQTLNGLNTDLSLIASVVLDNNISLTDINLLNNFTQNTLTIKDNDMLASLSALSNYTGGILTIDGNALLNDLTGLQNYTNSPQLNIYNTNLTSLSGIGTILEFGNSLRIENNSNLTTLSALSSVESIGFSGAPITNFNIINNNLLTSLEGFESLTNIEADIRFTGNALLEDFCAIETAINNGLTRAYFVTSNLYNPTVSDFNNGMCSLLGVDEFDVSTIKIFPNPVHNFLSIETSVQIINAELFNLQGQKTSCNYKNSLISVSHLSPNMYILKLTDSENRVSTFKIIKE